MEFYQEIQGPMGVLRGIVHVPSQGRIIGAALIMHGYFASSKLGPYRLYVQLARIFAKHGFYVWRFDCYGVGDSEGRFEEASYFSQLFDYQRVLERALSATPMPPTLIIGHSMSTSLAIRLALNNESITHLLLISPSLGFPAKINRLFTDQQLESLMQGASVRRKGQMIHPENILPAFSEGIFEMSKSLSISSTVVYGTSDGMYDTNAVQKMISAIKPDHYFEIEGADHNFLIGNSRLELLRLIQRHILVWITSDDLTDWE